MDLTLHTLRELQQAVAHETRLRETRRDEWAIRCATLDTKRALGRATDLLRRQGVEV